MAAKYEIFVGKMSPAASLVKCTSIIFRMAFLLQQRSVIRYYCLRGKADAQIITKPEQGYHWDALCLRAVEKWGAESRAGRETVGDDEKPERRTQVGLGEAVLRFLETQPHSSS
jgi:hypothetical protein